jgi:hypothetical protein
MSPTKTLLWMDNDGPQRFRSYRRWLDKQGWEVRWASTIEEAMRALCDEPIHALVLDQLVPFSGTLPDGTAPDGPPKVWGGCLVAWLLRRRRLPPHFPTEHEDQACEWLKLAPYPGNDEVPILLFSAYRDDHVEGALLEIKNGEFVVPILEKPVLLDDFIEKFRSVVEV